MYHWKTTQNGITGKPHIISRATTSTLRLGIRLKFHDSELPENFGLSSSVLEPVVAKLSHVK